MVNMERYRDRYWYVFLIIFLIIRYMFIVGYNNREITAFNLTED